MFNLRETLYFLLLGTILVHLVCCSHNENTCNMISNIESFVFVYGYLKPESVDCNGNIKITP